MERYRAISTGVGHCVFRENEIIAECLEIEVAAEIAAALNAANAVKPETREELLERMLQRRDESIAELKRQRDAVAELLAEARRRK